MKTELRSLLLCPWPGVNELRAMYVIEAGEEVIIAIENSQNRLSFVFVSTRQIILLSILV